MFSQPSLSMKFGIFSGLVFIGFVGLAVRPARAVDVGELAIHGSLSLSESESNAYNFYGNTADRFDFNQKELTLNGGHQFANGLRASAQLYAYNLDGFTQLTLDFASLDYSFAPWLGIRLGRNKFANGLYGDGQDLDQVRIFANLPAATYPRSLRPITSADGISVYGTASAHWAGSFDYSAFFGRIDDIPSNALAARSADSLTIIDELKPKYLDGAGLYWNLPADGLRLGITTVQVPDVTVDAHLATEAFATRPGLSYNATPLLIDHLYGAGAWDHAFAGQPAPTKADYYFHIASIEYTLGSWIFAAEYHTLNRSVTANIPALQVVNSFTMERQHDYYFMANWQATKQIGAGAYYQFESTDPDRTTGLPGSVTTSRDVAGVLAYSPFSWWVLKVEFHRIDGLALLTSAGDYNPNALTRGRMWNYLTFKSTFSF